MDYTSVNKKWWNSVTPVHAQSELYDLEGFKKGITSLQSIERAEVGSVRNKSLLHLLCHFGMDTLSWARNGAEVTGVDLSDHSIKLAKKLSREIKVPATFICSDIYDLPHVLDKKFDIVFASYGVILWLSNLKKFGEIVNSFLKPGGMFYVVDLHPFTNLLDPDLHLTYDYFYHGPFKDDSDGTYTDWDSKAVTGTTYQWSYSVSEILDAVISHGLQLEFFHEFPYTVYNQYPGYMTKDKNGHFILKDDSIQFPLLFSLKAVK